MYPLKKIGVVRPFKSAEIGDSRIGIGFEKLDRAVFDPAPAYDKIAATGVKLIRLQSGWARTERERGVYDFAWLDEIVEALVSRGLTPWLCLCYGNALYTPSAGEVFGAVGCPPIHTAGERAAWSNYVTALAAHYRDRVSLFEVWNEPDGKWCWKHGVSGTEYGRFVQATAAAVKAGNPEAKIAGGSLCKRGLAWFDEMLRSGAAEAMDFVTYHDYNPDETLGFDRVRALRALAKHYNPAIEIIQGENGAQSRSDGHGALHTCAWTPEKQAKYLARHLISDLFNQVVFTSYFSSVDMIEALNGVVGNKASYLDFGYFGVLAADFDADGVATGNYTPKPSYRALQTVAALFRDGVEYCELPVLFYNGCDSPRIMGPDTASRDLVWGGFKKPNGAAAFAYWKPDNLLSTTFDGSVTLESAALPLPVRVIDSVDGSVYEIPESMIENLDGGVYRFNHLPLREYPLLLAFGEFAELE